MNLSDLQKKDVVNLIDGKKNGSIIDVIINDEGKIDKIVLLKRRFLNFFKNEETEIRWIDINKIGEDVILINNKSTD